jgi:predicted nucleic acid-binding protein
VIVLDCAAIVDYLLGLEYETWVEQQLVVEFEAHVPYVLDIELAHALRGLNRVGKVSGRRAETAFSDFAELALRRYPHLPFLDRIWQLRTHITAYDAAYVALAEALDAKLVTTDLRLARTHGHRARIVAPE